MSDPRQSPSAVRRLGTHVFGGMDVWQLIEMRARVIGDRPYLIWHPYEGEPRTWSYRELRMDAAAAAEGLRRRGVKPGDHVLIHLENCPEFVIAWFACAALGAIAVTTNTRSAGDELGYFARDCGAVGAITHPDLAAVVSSSAPGLSWQVVTSPPAEGRPERRDRDSFSELLVSGEELPTRPIEPMAPMCVQYTSGTTSRPKGVVWTHANALWGARQNAAHEDLHPVDCQLAYMPLFHTNALSYSMLATLWAGSRFVLVPKWSTRQFWDVSRAYGCTFLSLMGLSYRALSEAEPRRDHAYRNFGFGLADTPLDAKLGVKTIGWFGMTETVSHPTIGSPVFPDRPMSMGRPAPEYGVAVVRDDGRTPTEPGEVGELLVKGLPGLSLFSEYLNQPQATAESFDELGWFKTGDHVAMHTDGYISYSHRAKDMLRVGAENVATAEVERVILQTGAVVEVAVVGRYDKKLDEVPVAFVIPRAPRDGLADYLIAECADKLADFKVPRAVYEVSEMPRSTLYKINKVELRKVAADDTGRLAAERRWMSEAVRNPSGDLQPEGPAPLREVTDD